MKLELVNKLTADDISFATKLYYLDGLLEAYRDEENQGLEELTILRQAAHLFLRERGFAQECSKQIQKMLNSIENILSTVEDWEKSLAQTKERYTKAKNKTLQEMRKAKEARKDFDEINTQFKKDEGNLQEILMEGPTLSSDDAPRDQKSLKMIAIAQQNFNKSREQKEQASRRKEAAEKGVINAEMAEQDALKDIDSLKSGELGVLQVLKDPIHNLPQSLDLAKCRRTDLG